MWGMVGMTPSVLETIWAERAARAGTVELRKLHREAAILFWITIAASTLMGLAARMFL
jgi:hypothetical protein